MLQILLQRCHLYSLSLAISGCPTQQLLPVLTRQFASIGLLCFMNMSAGTSGSVHSREDIQWTWPDRQHVEEAQRAVLPRGDKDCLHDTLQSHQIFV